MSSLDRAYDIRQDVETIKATQRTTRDTDGGLALANGLLCYSDEWFNAVETGQLPSTTLEGVITRVFMSGHNDWPEFELEADGAKTRWTRNVSGRYRGNGDRLFEVGRKVRLKYVEHPWKAGQPGSQILGTHAKLVMYIEIEPAT